MVAAGIRLRLAFTQLAGETPALSHFHKLQVGQRPMSNCTG